MSSGGSSHSSTTDADGAVNSATANGGTIGQPDGNAWALPNSVVSASPNPAIPAKQASTATSAKADSQKQINRFSAAVDDKQSTNSDANLYVIEFDVDAVFDPKRIELSSFQ